MKSLITKEKYYIQNITLILEKMKKKFINYKIRMQEIFASIT